ncbi:hypothetical protein PIB30_045728 [Stylosanthes scabra]|uniref:Uncharacterized protein n=1 Tax=Stylosanthes scabra TaxID=79078 RepID=A0ABU6XHW0_9FABA|nr:hypothetical protein [Stylosanthes scabra]
MRGPLIKLEPRDSRMLVKKEASYPEDKRNRAERRWKRRGLSFNVDSNPNCFASAARITVKSCGDVAFLSDNDVHMVDDDEVDEDYKILLDRRRRRSEIYDDVYMIDLDEADEDYRTLLDGRSEISDVISNIENDEEDEDFRQFLDTIDLSDDDHDSDQRSEGNSEVSSESMHNQHVDISYGGKEKELEETGDALESQHVLETERGASIEITGEDVDEDYAAFLNSKTADGLVPSHVENNPLVLNHAFDNTNMQCDVNKEQTGNKSECDHNLDYERGPFDERPSSDDSVVPKNNCNTGLDSHNVDEDYQMFLTSGRMVDESLQPGSEAGRRSSIMNESQVSDHAFGNPSVQFDVVEEHTVDPVESDQTERGPFIRKKCSDDSIAPKNYCNDEQESDNIDEDYKIFLNSIPSYSGTDESLMSREVGSESDGRSSCIKSSSQVSDPAYRTPEGQCNVGNEQIGGPLESQQSLETEGASFDRSPHLNVSGVSMRNSESMVDCDEDYERFLNSYMVDDDGPMTVRVESGEKVKSSNVRNNSQASDQAFVTPDSKQQFQSSVTADGNLLHMQDNNITKTCMADTDRSCSDSDVILLEPDEIGENNPFIFSKAFDSSYFENETNPTDRGKLSLSTHSELRTRLMKDLNRPYNQEEHDKLLDLLHIQLHKERHMESRRGLVKPYHSHGVNKSYFELYPEHSTMSLLKSSDMGGDANSVVFT